MCWNGRYMNSFIQVRSFKFETPQVAASLMRTGDFMFVVDMKSGYHHVPLKPEFKKYCCFRWDNEVYRWNVLPFGISSGPRANSKLSKIMVKMWRSRGVRCSNYIDDFIFFATSMSNAVALRDLVLHEMVTLGWFVGLQKSSLLVLAQRVVYLGFEFCSAPQPYVAVPPRRITAALTLVNSIIQTEYRYRATAGRSVAQLAGTLQSMRFAVPTVHLFTRAMYSWLARLPPNDLGFANLSYRKRLSAPLLEELKFWALRLKDWNGASVRPGFVQKVLYTNADRRGWQGILHRVRDRQSEPARLDSATWELTAPAAAVASEL